MYKSILVSIDLNHKSSWEKVLPQAVSLAKQYNSIIHIMSVIPDFGMPIVGQQFPENYSKMMIKEVSTSLNVLLNKEIPSKISWKAHICHGSIYKEILNAAKKLKCDLIVIASHRPEMKDYLLGPNAARIVRHAPQSVFVVR